MNGKFPIWWKILLNYTIPYILEMLLCLYMNRRKSIILNNPLTELKVSTTPSDYATEPVFPKSGIYSGMTERTKDIQNEIETAEIFVVNNEIGGNQLRQIHGHNVLRQHYSCPTLFEGTGDYSDVNLIELIVI